jgi:uncharacterized protein (TIGR00255 family)
MTGFARSSVTAGSTTVTVELRSVNSRFLDLHFKTPENLRGLEPALRERLNRAFNRGKLEVMLRLGQDSADLTQIDESRLTTLIAALNTVSARLGEPARVDPLALLLTPGILGDGQRDDEGIARAALTAADAAIRELAEQRQREGQVLADLIRERARTLRHLLAALRQQLPQLREAQRHRILARIVDAGVEPDAKRLEEELVYIAQRADVEEEMDRIDAHLDAIADALDSGKPCGRRLNFLMQELNREANTLSSKSTALTTTNTAVEFKLLIEQMREQIQNIE